MRGTIRWYGSTATPAGAAVTVSTMAVTAGLVALAAWAGPAVGFVLVGASLLSLVVIAQGTERTGTALAILAMALSPMNSIRPSSAVSFVTASDAMFVLAFGLLLPTLLRRRVQLPATLMVGIFVLVAAALVSSILSSVPYLSLALTVRLVVGAFGLPLLFLIWRPPELIVRWLAGAYLFGAALNTVMAVLRGPDGDGGRYAGFTTHPNIFGLTMLLAAAVVPFLCHRVTLVVQIPILLGGLIASYGLYLSGSRAALAVLLGLVLIYPHLTRSLTPVLFIVTGFALFLIFSDRFLEADSGNAIGRLLGGGSAEGSDIERASVRREAIANFTESPIIGTGLGGVLEAHNIYLQALAAVGVIGIVGYLLVFFAACRPLLTLPTPYHLLALPALAYAILGMVTSLMWDRYIWSMMALAFLAPILARRDARGTENEDATAVSPTSTAPTGG